MRLVMIAFIKAYQYFISPALGNHCRFYPSCSCYAMEAIKRHGVFLGSYLTAVRLLKCQPFHQGGIDPVPEQFGKK